MWASWLTLAVLIQYIAAPKKASFSKTRSRARADDMRSQNHEPETTEADLYFLQEHFPQGTAPIIHWLPSPSDATPRINMWKSYIDIMQLPPGICSPGVVGNLKLTVDGHLIKSDFRSFGDEAPDVPVGDWITPGQVDTDQGNFK